MFKRWFKVTPTKVAALFISVLLISSSCKEKRSAITGWKYNNPKWGGFEVRPYAGQ